MAIPPRVPSGIPNGGTAIAVLSSPVRGGARPALLARLTWRHGVRDGLILAGYLFTAYAFLVARVRDGAIGFDTYSWWSVDLANLYERSMGAYGTLGAFRYSPAIAPVFLPARALEFWQFEWLWLALLVGTLIWLARDRLILVLAFPPIWLELANGNIHLLMAAAIVIGLRHPGAWAFLLLTKVTPGIGLLWFVTRREWRSLAIVAGVTGTIVAVSLAVTPQLWPAWLAMLTDNAAVGTPLVNVLPVTYRLPIAAVVVVWGARSDRPWVLPVAAVLALPVLSLDGLALLAAIPALMRRDAGRQAARLWPMPTRVISGGS